MSSFVGFGAKFDPVPAEVARRLGAIGRCAGRADLYRQQFPRLLDALRDRARVESVTASSAIEGVVAPAARVQAVVLEPSETPRTRSEQELRGYSNALTHVFTEAAHETQLSVGVILHLHRLLFEPTRMVGAGRFKTADNLVVGRRPGGATAVRFRPVAAARTPQAVADLVGSFNDVVARGTHDRMLLAAAAVLDFTVIHPFADGNGRVSRLLLNLLLCQAGHDVGRYVSLERLIEQTEERYYDVLLASTHGWEDGENDVWPAVAYTTEVVERAYTRFVELGETERAAGSKQERVRRYLEEHGRRSFSMAELRTALPGISDATFRVVLNSLRDEGKVVASSGRTARWRWRAPE